MHQACWPTSSSNARLSAACLVEATSDNNLNDGSNSMSIKTEIMSLGLDVKVIFCQATKEHGYCIGFYMIPYIQAYLLELAHMPAAKEATSFMGVNVQSDR